MVDTISDVEAVRLLAQHDANGSVAKSVGAMKPWHDAPRCPECKDGPLTPCMTNPHDKLGEPHHLRCCACGHRVDETDPRRVAQAWWSAGAYEGKMEAERTR